MAAPSHASRTTARLTTAAAQAPNACTPRAAINVSMFGVSQHAALARQNVKSPRRSTRRRPKRSVIGPSASCAAAKVTRKTVNVDCTNGTPAARPSAIAGTEGR